MEEINTEILQFDLLKGVRNHSLELCVSFINFVICLLPFYHYYLEPRTVLSHFSCVRLFATLWTAACQAPLEWVAISSFRGSSRPRDRTHVSWVSCIGRWVLCH